MRAPAPRTLLLLVIALLVSAGSSAFAGDPRTEARTHYQAGVKAYGSGDYRVAIQEFSAAQQLAPADLNNYNLALCYDKLGEAEPAIRYYREFLNKQPNADKRTEIEASVSRLEAALASTAAKRADEQKKIDDARKAEEARVAEEARKAEETRNAEEAARRPKLPPVEDRPADPAMGAGSTGTPSSGQAVSTGDAQLDRVSSIDVGSIRDQRMGGASSGMAGPVTNAPATNGANGPNAGMPQNGGPAGPGMPSDQPKKATPVYKKWWFWAVVAVSAYVVYSIATEGSNSPNRARTLDPVAPPMPEAGVPLLRF